MNSQHRSVAAGCGGLVVTAAALILTAAVAAWAITTAIRLGLGG